MVYRNQHLRADHRLENKMDADKGKAEKSVKDVITNLTLGDTYIIMATIYGLPENKSGVSEAPVKMELVGLFPHVARFRRKAEYTESFSYWDLARRLQG